MNPFEIQKSRTLTFAGGEAQLSQAYELLSNLENMRVERCPQANTLRIHYSLEHYSLEGLEKALINEGFRFADSWPQRLYKVLLRYIEGVQYHNLGTPEHQVKNNHPEIFAQAYDQHAHGDRDETPKEMREYK